MKDVVLGASARVLVTGFGPFPGAPTNPTLGMLERLENHGVTGVDLVLVQLPVVFGAVRAALRRAVVDSRPDAILLMGLATRRRAISVETLAANRIGPVQADADGRIPSRRTIERGGPASVEATWPAAAVLAALLAHGHDAHLSRDAGDYVCNATLFHALRDGLAPRIGFLHVPPPDSADPARPSLDRLADAARIAVGTIAAARIGLRDRACA